jgi:hypothetical protein
MSLTPDLSILSGTGNSIKVTIGIKLPLDPSPATIGPFTLKAAPLPPALVSILRHSRKMVFSAIYDTG